MDLDVAGTRFAATVSGEGPVVVLVHAGVADQRMWDPVVAELDGRRVARYDLRGFGRTEPGAGRFAHHRDLLAVLDALGIERAVLAGASFGGLVALDAAAVAPQRVVALVLQAPALPDHEWSDAMVSFFEAEEAAIEARDLDRAVQLNVDFWAGALDDEGRALVAAMQRRAFELQLAADLEEDELEPPVTARLADVAMPVHVLVGEEDKPDFRAIAERLARELPDARLDVVPGAGHLVGMERPDVVAAAIAAATRGD